MSYTDSNINFETNNDADVVQNDTQSNTAEKQINAAVVSAVFILNHISYERESWEQNEYAASRQKQYAVLGRCYDYYITMKHDADDAIRDDYEKALNDSCEQRGYKFNSKTHDMHRIIKCVFGDANRRRISAYAQVLIAALSGGGFNDEGEAVAVLPANLTSWIEDQGGIEKIRTGKKNNGMTRKEQAEVAVDVLEESNALSMINADFKTYGIDSNDSDKQMLLLVTYRNTGKFEVNAVVKDQAAVNAALACYFKNYKLQETNAAVSGKTSQSASAE